MEDGSEDTSSVGIRSWFLLSQFKATASSQKFIDFHFAELMIDFEILEVI